MLALPPMSPLLEAAVVLIGLLLAAAALGTLGSAVVRRLANPVGAYRVLYGVVLLPATVLAYVLLALVDLGPAVLAAVGIPPTGPPSGVLTDLIELVAAGLVWLAAYAPTIRGVATVRELELSTWRALRRMARFVAVVCVVVTIAVAPLRLATPALTPVLVAAGLGVVGLLLVYGSPWLMPIVRDVRRPNDGTRKRLAALCDRAALDVVDIAVIATDDERTATALVRGPPPRRRLFVTTTFLDEYDDETAAALLAIRTGRLRYRLLEIRIATVLLVGLLLIAALTGVGPAVPLLVAAVVVLLVGLQLSRRGFRAADAYAADRLGAPTVSAALQRHADVHSIEPTRRRVPNPLAVNVPLGDRLDRLRRGASA